MKALFCVVVLLFIAQCTLGQVNFYLGTISVSFDDEDPHQGLDTDEIITIGSSIGATITLDPVPDFPQRFEIISTIPDIIHVSHSTVIFSRGQESAHIVLESPSNGKIGKSAILVTPEKNGYYEPLEFDIFVQGIISVGFFDDDDCVGVGQLEKIVVSFQPPVPGNVELNLNATSGVFVNETVIVETGKETETLFFNGTDISKTTIYINVTGLLYPSLTLDFDVFGTILTSPDTYYMIQGAPKYFNVSVLPAIDPRNPPFISTSASNAIVTPNAFVLESDGVTEVEVIPIFYGISRVTFSSENYCPASRIFSVAVAPICAEGFVPNIIGDTCVICPGNFNNPYVYFADSTCNENGDCGYSKCFTNKAVCFCNYPYVGYACQWDSIEDVSLFDSAELNDDPFMLHVDNFPHTTGPTAFYAPGDLVADNLQPGTAIVAGYDPEDPFFGGVNPESNPPAGTTYSGISWYWENTCADNTIITNDFTAPVNMTIPIEPEIFTSEFLVQAQIWRHDDNTGNWVKSNSICQRIGYNSTYLTADLLAYTVSGSFCAPGQYAIFIVPVTPVPANTGNTIVRNPSFDELSTTASGTGKTGWQPKPPAKPPVNAPNFDPSPGKVLHLTSADEAVTIASGSITAVSVALLSAFLLLLF